MDLTHSPWKSSWQLRQDTTYLNHGSFGPPPEPVRLARLRWQRALDSQPMDFCVRQFEPAWRHARDRLAQLVGARSDDLAFVENATYAMNAVANSFPLALDDEVLLTDHEYGAVVRIWQRACDRVGAHLRTVRLPAPLDSAGQIVDCLNFAFGAKTRLLVVSHITSPTAVTMPVAAICQAAKKWGVATCIDGPHAIAQLPLNLDSLLCDFYTASCHKWLSAPFGSGFLWVAPQHQAQMTPPLLSWGRLSPQPVASWSDEFCWTGTRDPSPYLAVPDAIDFLEQLGWDTFRHWTHALAREARSRISELVQLAPLIPDDPAWYGTMAHVPLPPGDSYRLQAALWNEFGIEVPIVRWKEQRWIRVSCHLYNDRRDLDRLLAALSKLLAKGE